MKYLQVGILVALVAVAGLLALNLLNDRQARLETASAPATEELSDAMTAEEPLAAGSEEPATDTNDASNKSELTTDIASSTTVPQPAEAARDTRPAARPSAAPQQSAKQRGGASGDAPTASGDAPAASGDATTASGNATGKSQPAVSSSPTIGADPSRTEPFQVDPPSATGGQRADATESASMGQQRNRYEIMRPDPPGASNSAPAPKATSAPEPPRVVTLPAGTILTVRTTRLLSSETAAVDEVFTATLDQPIVIEDMVIAERGSRVEGRVVQVVDSGRVKGLASLAIQVTRMNTSDGQTVPVQTQTFTMEAESSRGRDATKVGIATGVGAALGAIFGGGRGAAIGAAAGAGAGTGGVLVSKGNAAEIPSETRINFRLETPVTLTEQINP